MDGELIKSFLVGLGFGVDDASLAKFNKSIASASLKVAALYGSIKLTAAGIYYGIAKISQGFEQMGYEYHIIAPMINKALLLRQELIKAYTAAGINISKVVRDSYKLNLSLTKTRFAFEAIYKSVASRFFETITKQSDVFRSRIYANMPKIQSILERFVKFVFKALDATTALGIRLWSILGRVYTFLKDLDEATSGWSSVVLGLIAVWELLNLSFLASPLGIILSLGAAILALYDDYKTFQEGGQSFFNWSSFIPVITAVTNAVKSMWAVLQSIADVLANIALAFYQAFKGDWSGALDSLKAGLSSYIGYLQNLWNVITGVGGAFMAIGNWGQGLFGGANASSNAQAAPRGIPAVSPVSSSTTSNSAQTNQHLQNQTNISVIGSPDANATGKAIAGEQNQVNLNLARNMKGSIKAGGIIPQ